MTTYVYTIELMDYTFFALENLLKDECKKIEKLHGIKAFDPETGEANHPYGEILRIMKESQSSARLNSFYRLGHPE